MNVLKHTIKKLIYGTPPYYSMRGYKPNSPYLKYYERIEKREYSGHLYEFKGEYASMPVDVQKDEEKGLYYVQKERKRLYLRESISTKKIQKYYRTSGMEQDRCSPHHCFSNAKEATGGVFVDVGCAEEYSSLEIIEEAKHVYSFEQDGQWLEVIRVTFEPWRDKVTVVREYVSDHNSSRKQTLDDFLNNQTNEHLLFRMDIEGAERRALTGYNNLFQNCQKLDFAICTYYLRNDEEIVSAFLDKYNYTYTSQKGFFRYKIHSVMIRGSKKQSLTISREQLTIIILAQVCIIDVLFLSQ